MAYSRSSSVRELERFLDAACVSPAKIILCPDCGSVTERVEANLHLFGRGGDRSWNILLPVCPKCVAAEEERALSHPKTGTRSSGERGKDVTHTHKSTAVMVQVV